MLYIFIYIHTQYAKWTYIFIQFSGNYFRDISVRSVLYRNKGGTCLLCFIEVVNRKQNPYTHGTCNIITFKMG